jgi:hypothetical protein
MLDGPQDKIADLIPDDGFFRWYHEMTKGTEICPRFHFFTAACCMGAVVNREVKFQRSSADVFPTLFPNPWIVLVAPQGVGHKTAALAIGKKLLMKMPSYTQPRFLSAKITPEALVKTLAAPDVDTTNVKLPAGINPAFLKPNASGLLYSTEIGVLLGREKYNAGMIALLTELYDCHDEWTSATIMRGDQKLFNVCLSLLGASTPDWMQSMLPSDAFKGGFMSRLLLIAMPVGWERRRVADPPKPPTELRERLVVEIDRINNIVGEMKWEPAARDFFHDWYMKVERAPAPGPVMAYLERKQDHLLRFAILLELASTHEQLILTRPSIERSLALLETVENETSPMVEYLATEPRMRSAQNVLEILRSHPEGMTEAKLLSMIWRSLAYPREFDEIMMMLLKAKSIRIRTQTPEMRGDLVYERVE